MAHSDELTGLPNRALFMDRLQQLMIHARRELNRFALLYVDLDGFKEVNAAMYAAKAAGKNTYRYWERG